MAFDVNKYKQEFNKKNYSTFKVDLKKEEKKKLDTLLKSENMKGAEFLRLAIKALENGTLKKEEDS